MKCDACTYDRLHSVPFSGDCIRGWGFVILNSVIINLCYNAYLIKTRLTLGAALLMMEDACWWLLPYRIWLFICRDRQNESCYTGGNLFLLTEDRMTPSQIRTNYCILCCNDYLKYLNNQINKIYIYCKICIDQVIMIISKWPTLHSQWTKLCKKKLL